jgi:acetyl-CoA acetyltransferase
MTVRRFDGAVVAGWHELPVAKRGDQAARTLLGEAVAGALRHAGIPGGEVDGLAVGGFTLGPDHAVDLAAALGLRVGWLAPQDPGGSGAVNALLQACTAVRAGDARVVVCASADTTDSASLARLNTAFSSSFEEGLTPVGAASPTAIFAFLQREHMAVHGTRREDFGEIAVRSRANGVRNPAALFREPLDIEQYLAAVPVVEPLHLFDCVHPGHGAAAFVVTDHAYARARSGQRVRVDAGFVRHHPARSGPLDFGWTAHRDALFEAAGRGPHDFSVLEFYDDYPFMVAAQLEELGFADRGGLGDLLAMHDFTPEGNLPLNTGGGMLSCGQAGGAGGYLPIVEGLRQVAGQAEGRQVPGASSALVTGLGMVDQHGPQSIGAVALSNGG